MVEENRIDKNPPLLTSVRVACREFPHVAAEKAILQLIESFVDTSVNYPLDVACTKSLELVKRVLSRLNRGQVLAELCDAVGSRDLEIISMLYAAAEERLGTRTSDLVNERDAGGNSALSKAVWRGNVPMLEWLLAQGVHLNARNSRGQTALHQAATEGKREILEWLVNNGLQFQDEDGDGFTALLKAAQHGRLSVVGWLLENGADVNTQNSIGQTALHLASGGLRENLELVKILVGHGLKVSRTDKWEQTALHYAAVAKHFEIIEYFLEQCCHDEEPRMTDLVTAVFAASNADRVEFVEYLIENFGVDISHVNSQGRTALHEAAAGDSVETADLLVKRGLLVDQADNTGVTPIIEASRFGSSRVLSFLLSVDWNTDDVDFAGRTALHHAAGGGHMAVIDTLLYSSEINCCDKRGWTPLHCAAADGRLRVVRTLIECGAALDCETISGKSAVVLALERGHSEMARFLVNQMSENTPESAPEPLTTSSIILDEYAEYCLDPSDIQFESPLLQDSACGLWRDSPIAVKVKKSWQSKSTVEELALWSKLNHPHIVKLYGFCYGDDANDPFFVYERPTYSSLFEYLGIEVNRLRIWDKLYEAAMGLAYLHDRDVVHGDVSCASIAIAENGFAKLKNIGSKHNDNYFRENPSWTSPEVLSGSPPTFASDVYAFGVTIVQAFETSGDLWNLFGGARDAGILSGQLPTKPDAMSPQQWQLIQRMCCLGPQDRVSASDVVRELEAFTSKHEKQENSSLELDEHDIPRCWSSLGDMKMILASTILKLEEVLNAIDRMTGEAVPMNEMNHDVYERLADVFEQLKARDDSPTLQLVQLYTNVLHYFMGRLESTRSLGVHLAARFASIRQEADNAFSVHGDIDLLMDNAGLSRTTAIHDWRVTWKYRVDEHRGTIMEKLNDVSSLLEALENESEREEALTYLRFELTKHPTNYFITRSPTDVASAKAVISSLTTSKNSHWFIPAYEVEFNSFNEFSSGAFGSVHHGKWKSAQVIVKKLKLPNRKKQALLYDSDAYSVSDDPVSNSANLPLMENIQAAFLNEVEIWYKLYHPSVVQMFGACHIGEPFFVCEFAGGGQLDKYLRSRPDDVWVKLHEAALGLRYLHSKLIVHGDLKCNNILIGNDGRAKLTDFGLSSLEMNAEDDVEEPEIEMEDNPSHNVGAIRWKAPEILRGEKSTFASDVYSLGMCILEAVSGAYPWGAIDDTAVKFHVITKQCIPQCPTNCDEKAYALVQQMCQFEATTRIGMDAVVNGLADLRL